MYPRKSVRIVHKRDTDVVPYDMGTLGSRSLFTWGMRFQRAPAADVRSKIAALRQEVGEPEGSNLPIFRALSRSDMAMQAG